MRSPRGADGWGRARKCVLPSRLRCALSTCSTWKLALCLRPQPARPGLAAWQWQWAGAKDVSLNTKPFSTWVPFTATRLATIELGFGRNSSVILNWFFVSLVAGEFWVLQIRRWELSVAPASYSGIRHGTVSCFGPQFLLHSVGGFGMVSSEDHSSGSPVNLLIAMRHLATKLYRIFGQ